MNTANKITLIRIAMIPVFLFFFLTDIVPFSSYIALLIFIVAAATDGIDGHIARKYNQITDFGKFIDPLADKILVVSALIGMVYFRQISPVGVIIIIAREFIVTGLRIVAISSGKVIAAAFSGKLKTVTQIVVVVYIMLFAPIWDNFAFLKIISYIGEWAMVAITVYSGAEYMVKNKHLIDYRK
ncbi:MAG: CDP-diacylglycerol--glycerol-3-phosphate 3-phosphatidyltransferase [Ruminococcaceae bacterium]|nr:CDP-diacylglycerol--glycerol-3-phosphate 3-phosphatidyltransferase [Oscillospiraceae bacterium]